MTPGEIRSRYLEFYKVRGHAVIPSASLVPENDPTTLFTGSGMQPLVPYLLGKNHPEGVRLCDSQKCFRSGDIEEVGDNRHTTFFEMLGNWSLGDYFKQDQLPWIFEFLTNPEHGLGLDPAHLYVTVFSGSDAAGIGRDDEAVALWKRLFTEKNIDATDVELLSEKHGGEVGMQGGRIFYYDAKKNWWSRAGVPENMPAGEPGGPDSEIFYEFTDVPHNKRFGEHCHPNCDCGRFLEIGNSVFMEFIKDVDGSFSKLPKRNVDFGGGLDRLAMVSENNPDIIAVNHKPIIAHLEAASGKTYGADDTYTRAFRIIADHMKAAVFLIGDGVLPGNADQGYFVRRLIRRAVRYADTLGIGESTLADVVRPIADMYADHYSELREHVDDIRTAIAAEEERFRTTLAKGLREFERHAGGPTAHMSGEEAFTLFSTYGFPLELTVELAGERGMTVDTDGFARAMSKHQELSRSGSEQKFKGGLADAGEQTTKLHTAHHLLLKALQTVLGHEVHQRGSNITAERLRIDFNYGQKMTDEQKDAVEKLVNEKIAEDLPVTHSNLPRGEAEALGAEHEFGAKYPDRVSVYGVGPAGATDDNPRHTEAFSLEFCGGPHVAHTGALGHFKIQKEEASSQGIRRIKAVLE